MADAKISALPAATTPLAGTEVLPIVQSGTTKKVSVANLTAGRDISVFGLTATGNTVLGDASTDTLNVGNGDLVKDASGNLGFGRTPSAWTNNYKVIQTQSAFLGSNDANNLLIGQNIYVNSGNYVYLNTNLASFYQQGTGLHKWFSAPSGTAGTNPTFTQVMGTTTDNYLLIGYTSSNGAYRLQVNGQIFATSSTIATSDARYKENVAPLTNALDLVLSLNPVTFNWKNHSVHNFPSGVTTGFIAQEVKAALADTPFVDSIVKASTCVLSAASESVGVSPDAPEQGTAKEAVTEEFLGIAEGNLIALLTAAIKEQQSLIADLTARVADLEAR